MFIVKNQNGAIIQVYGVEPIDNDEDTYDATYSIMGIIDPVKPIKTLLGEYKSKKIRDIVMEAIEEMLDPFVMPTDSEECENIKSYDNYYDG